MMRSVYLERAALCPCGETMLRDGIPLGTEYLIDDEHTLMGTLTCGACGTLFVEVLCVLARRPGHGSSGYLPMRLFE